MYTCVVFLDPYIRVFMFVPEKITKFYEVLSGKPVRKGDKPNQVKKHNPSSFYETTVLKRFSVARITRETQSGILKSIELLFFELKI